MSRAAALSFDAAGFVLALIAAWVFEITPDGVRLERDIDRSNYESNTGAGKNYLIIGLLVVALGVFITFNLTGTRDDSPQSGDAIAAFMEAFPKDHPLYPVGKSFWFYLKRDYEAALLEVSRYADDPAFPQNFTYPLVIGAAIMNRDLERAYEYLIKSSPGLIKDAENTVTSFNTQSAALLAYVEQQRNHPQVAANLLRQAAAIVHEMPRLGMSGYGIRDLQILTLQGRHDEAIEALTQAVDGWPFDEDPLIDPLRNDPRFEALTQRINQRLEEMRKNVDQARDSGDWSALLAKAASA